MDEGIWTVKRLIARLQQENPEALVLTIAGPLKGGLGFREFLHMERMQVVKNRRARRSRKDGEGEYLGIEESAVGQKTRAKRIPAFFIA